MFRKLNHINFKDLAERYLSGVSMEKLAAETGMKYTTIKDHFLKDGVQLRTIQQRNKTRYSGTTLSCRRKLTEKANRTMRGRPMLRTAMEKGALTRSKGRCRSGAMIGKYERELLPFLRDRGFEVTPQKSVGPYNVDIAVGSVAVEISTMTNHPALNTAFSKRTKYLIKSGYTVMYIWASGRFFPRAVTADKVIAMAKFAQRNPTSVRKYRVIRGTGQHVMFSAYPDPSA